MNGDIEISPSIPLRLIKELAREIGIRGDEIHLITDTMNLMHDLTGHPMAEQLDIDVDETIKGWDRS